MIKQMIEVVCPICSDVLGTTSGNQGSIVIKCKKCKEYIKYNQRSRKCTLTEKPNSETTSGKRFY